PCHLDVILTNRYTKDTFYVAFCQTKKNSIWSPDPWKEKLVRKGISVGSVARARMMPKNFCRPIMQESEGAPLNHHVVVPTY
ncbi:MAG: hypothetical protein ACYSOJ_01755, partial [Planctomycetota bacterium]